MKKLLLGAAAVLALGAPGIASAQSVDPSVSFNLEGSVAEICGVAWSNGFTVFDVDFGELSTTPAGTTITIDPQGSIAYVCNVADGFTRTITSANGGKLRRDGSAGGSGNEIPYLIELTGGSGVNTAGYVSVSSLTSPQNFNGSAAFRNGQNSNVSFQVNGVQTGPGPQGSFSTSVFAGDYTDTLTIAVTAN